MQRFLDLQPDSTASGFQAELGWGPGVWGTHSVHREALYSALRFENEAFLTLPPGALASLWRSMTLGEGSVSRLQSLARDTG